MNESEQHPKTPSAANSKGNFSSELGDAFRKATRPIVTVIFAAVIAQVVVERINAPDWFLALAGTVILWWFGERTVRHVAKKGDAES
jgi:hypothetical protein